MILVIEALDPNAVQTKEVLNEIQKKIKHFTVGTATELVSSCHLSVLQMSQ